MPTPKYPLNFHFKILTIANDFSVVDATGKEIAYTRQKILRLRELVEVYNNSSQSHVDYYIEADRIIDFNACYMLRDQFKKLLGRIQRHGMRSIWRTSYTISDKDGFDIFTLQEANPWVALIDGVIGEIPYLGLLTGYFLNPSYKICNMQGKEVFRLKKRISLMERKFTLEKLHSATPEEEELVRLGVMMMLLLERGDG